MELLTCLNPVPVHDKFGNLSYVPCGKCVVCRERKSSDWVFRLQREAECWKDVFFVTLTYDDKNLPYCILKHNHLLDVSTGELVPDLELDVKARAYCRKLRKVSYPCVRDLQLFIKRLRYYYYEHCRINKNNFRSLRYFFVFEYGCTSHRIHLHGLIFFTDKTNLFTREFSGIVSKCWQLGFTDASSVQQASAATYVAKYLNCSTSRKSIYAHPFFRVRSVSSKCPAIGSLLPSEAVLRDIVQKKSVSFFIKYKNRGYDVQLPLCLQSRLFPKIPRFSTLSYDGLLSVYLICRTFPCESVNDFISYVDNYLFGYKCLNENSVYFYLASLIDLSNVDPYSSLRRVWRISRRVCTQASAFGMSVRDYVKCIFDFYIKLDFFKLKCFYETQEKLQRVTPKTPLVAWLLSDPAFILKCKNFDWSFMDLNVFYTINSFGLDPVEFLHNFDRYNRFYVAQVKTAQRSLASWEKGKNLKLKKDYLMKHSEFKEMREIYEKYF